mgnify:CR=1 FL=1
MNTKGGAGSSKNESGAQANASSKATGKNLKFEMGTSISPDKTQDLQGNALKQR